MDDGAVEAIAQTQASVSAPKEVDEAEKQSAEKVFNFIKLIRGVDALCSEELETYLWENRFDLMPRPKVPLPDSGPPKLPSCKQIPTLQELQKALIGGGLACGHQCVAHVLYPESVAWPAYGNQVEAAPSEDVQEERTAPETLTLAVPEADGAAPQLPGPASSPSRSKKVQQSSNRRNSSTNQSPLASRSSSKECLHDGDDVLSQHPMPIGKRIRSSSSSRSSECAGEVQLCGMKIRTTARGRPVLEQREDFNSAIENNADDSAYQVAKDKRQKMERTVKLEQYQEKKLAERIKALEMMRDSELHHQAAIQKRESKRQARNDELKKDMHSGWERRFEQERTAEEEEKQRKAEKDAADRRVQRQHEKQKDKLAERSLLGLDESASAQVRQRLKLQEQAKENARLRKEIEKAEKRTVRQLEAEDRVFRMNTATEERPPLPPRAHDLPAPIVDVLTGGESVASSARSASRRRPGSQQPSAPASARNLPSQVKAVSNMYGLSKDDRGNVEKALMSKVRGAGRLGQYDKDKPNEDMPNSARRRSNSPREAPPGQAAKVRGSSEPPAARDYPAMG